MLILRVHEGHLYKKKKKNTYTHTHVCKPYKTIRAKKTWLCIFYYFTESVTG